MLIAEVVNNLEVGGTERLVVDLAGALQARGHSLMVVCLRTAGPLAQRLEKAGIEIVPLRKAEGPSLATLGMLRRLLKQRRVDVVHTHNPLVHHYGVVGGKLAGVPVIVNTIHGVGNLSDRFGPKELLYSLSCRLSSRIVAVCAMAYRTFAAGGVIPLSRLVTINNGVPLGPFLEVGPRQDDGVLVFGIVGRLVSVKDHRTLLSAFASVLRAGVRCRLEILGDGPLRGELQQQAADLGIAADTVFHGFSADVAGFMRRIDISVLCSRSEGLPLGVLESMAAALPVVGTAVGGMPDLVREGGCGWLCPPGQPERLAEALLQAARTPAAERSRMGERGRQHAVENYSLERMTSEYEGLFEAILRGEAGTTPAP